MPRTIIHSWEQRKNGIGNLSFETPLNSTDPKTEKDEPADPYHEDWGLFAFLYESARTLAMGGLSGLIYLPGSPGRSVPPWTVPNTELGDTEPPAEPTPGGGGGAQNDLLNSLCTQENIAANPGVAELCMTLAVLDGCFALTDVIANLTAASIDTGNISFPNGCTMSVTNVDFCPLQPGVSGKEIFTITITCLGEPARVCNALYVARPQSGPTACGVPGGFIHPSFEAAKAAVLACVKDFFGNTYGSLGCT